MTEFSPDWLDAIAREIASRTGIAIRDRDRGVLAGKLEARVREAGFTDGRAYSEWLLGEPDALERRNAAQGREWQAVIQCVSVVESYLFRDRGQFQLLREQILPEAIERRRRVSRDTGQPPRLRLWSAACATGEEPYSLAILVRELLDDLECWDIRTIATDINEAALETARRATYSDWSFRQVEPDVRDRYFRRRRATSSGLTWQLDPEIAHLVSFHPFNLARSPYPDAHLHIEDLDLILCRNVFIYLKPEATDGILQRMARALNPDGYLLTAHAELQHRQTDSFQVCLYPQSVAYQRRDDTAPRSASDSLPCYQTRPPQIPHSIAPASVQPSNARSSQRHSSQTPALHASASRAPVSRPPQTPSPQTPRQTRPPISCLSQPTPTDGLISTPASTPASTPPARADRSSSAPPPISVPSRELADSISARIASDPDYIMQSAIDCFHRKAYATTTALLEQILDRHPRHFDACDLLALAYANLGQYHQASYYCSRALEIDPCAPSPHYLLAHLAETNGNIARAKLLLKRVVYLDPTATLAYLDLAAIYATQGDTARSRKMVQTARALLVKRSADEIVDPYRRLSVGVLREQLRDLSQGRDRFH